jgi:DNA-binding HxlR family transcriptional regulator/CheY-like chemotaxis protein
MVEKQYGCPVEVTLDLIGGKWKCVILWWLRRGSKRFKELMQLMPGVSQKVLTTQLRALESNGLISRQVFPESPPRVEYSLTAYGETLRPITELMCNWGKAHNPEFQFGLMCLRGLRILVIADELVNQRLEAELGELRGANVIATSLAIALRDLKDINPDIVLIDFSIDDDFRTLNQQLERLGADSQKPAPVIVLTTNDQQRDRAFSQGFRIHLMEPVEISELVAAIANLTRQLE